ncbi:MAG: glycosyltransferase family 2 protein [Myxococcota bacterium]|nr:glycosyltransferase family 2 protein [Myxococcota bacterium]
MLILVARFFLGLAVLGWLSSAIKIELRKRDRRWALGPGERALSGEQVVSVVVPARNEVDNIDGCVEHILAQEQVRVDLVVMDDGSTDGTTAILEEWARRDSRVSLLRGEESLPEGWYGKAWALHRAQASATASWLIFVDADVKLHPEAVTSVVAYAEENELDMVSGIGRLEMVTFWEKVMQPAVAGLILAGNDMDKVNDAESPNRVLANGQFIAIRRSAYDAVGGHESVRNNVLDDVGLAQQVTEAGFAYQFLVLRELFSCRMYTSFSEIWSGWSKNLFAGLRYSWATLLLVLFFLANQVLAGPVLLVLGLLDVLGTEWLVWGASLCALMQVVRFQMDRIWGLSPLFGLSHAPANLILMALLLNSGLSNRGGVAWKGRLVQ